MNGSKPDGRAGDGRRSTSKRTRCAERLSFAPSRRRTPAYLMSVPLGWRVRSARQRLECGRFIAAFTPLRAVASAGRVDCFTSRESGDKSPHSKRFATGNDFRSPMTPNAHSPSGSIVLGSTADLSVASAELAFEYPNTSTRDSLSLPAATARQRGERERVRMRGKGALASTAG